MTTSRRPLLGKDYRILAVKHEQHTRLVGRVITVRSVLDQDTLGVWTVNGRVHGIPGDIDLTAALQRDSGQCNCTAYDHPHSKTRSCV